MQRRGAAQPATHIEAQTLMERWVPAQQQAHHQARIRGALGLRAALHAMALQSAAVQ